MPVPSAKLLVGRLPLANLLHARATHARLELSLHLDTALRVKQGHLPEFFGHRSVSNIRLETAHSQPFQARLIGNVYLLLYHRYLITHESSLTLCELAPRQGEHVQ